MSPHNKTDNVLIP